MRITQLTAENVKRLKAVEIKPDGSIIEITGRNGQGKSSVLDSITYALGGKGVQPAKPIREGADSASIVVDLGDIIVERKWTANDKSYLSVTSRDGAKYPSPQAVLDKLVGELTFDPLAFSRMHPNDQVTTLKRVARLDFSKLDTERDECFSERTIINRDLKSAEARLSGIPAINAPDEEVSVAGLAKEHSEALSIVREKESLEANVAHLDRQLASSDARIKELMAEIDREEQRQASIREERTKAKRRLTTIQVPDVSAIATRLESAESTNLRVRAKKQRQAQSTRVEELQTRTRALSKRILEIDAEKEKALASSSLPVPGLSFTPEGVTLGGIPFSQASSAEQLKVSVAMGLALNPKLRVMLIRDGSLLDSASLKLLGELAEKSDAQIWLERVSDGEPVGVVIEDGCVSSSKGKKKSAETASV